MAEDNKTQLGPAGAASSAPSATGSKTSYLPPTEDALLGTTIAARYLVEKKLGEGGMGSVYLATHTILEKQVALKVLHGEFARKPDLVERFMQEAKAASRIRHENVIDISDFGSTPEGLVFFAMELLQGRDLHDVVTRARLSGHLLPWARSKKIFLQICGALSAAHARGVVHRDLKPENVYLVDFLGDPDFVKLLDFGIAKLTEVNEEGGRKLTKTGMLFGTPEYMSPEQARGEAVDHRVDIYAMGCILFQLVSGRVPFAADNFMGVLSLHLTEAPPAIEPEAFDQIGAPRALADVIDRALAKERDSRWQTIDDLANAVREVCGDPPLADRSGPNRVRSAPATVPAPATTTRPRPSTRQVEPGGGRQKTEWTGRLEIPEVPIEPPPAPRSRLPLILGAGVVVVAAAAVIGALALRGDPHAGAGEGSAAMAGSGSAASPGSAAGSGPALAAAPGGTGSSAAPVAPPAPVIPAMATIDLDSSPRGAVVTDLSTGKQIGKTPVHFSLPGSATARQFALHLHGYASSTVELVPNRAAIAYREALVKGTSHGHAAVHAVPDPAQPAAAVTEPDTSTAVTRPDPGPAKPAPPRPDPEKPGTATPDTSKPGTGAPDTSKPDTSKPDTSKPDTSKPDTSTKPTTTKPRAPGDDCPDDTQPCLKRNIPGLAGSGS